MARHHTSSSASISTTQGRLDPATARSRRKSAPLQLARRVLTPQLARTTAGQRYQAPANQLGGRLHLHLNENLLVSRPIPAALLRVELEDLARYPGGGARELELAIAERFELASERVYLGLGASALLNQIFAAFANCGAEALLPSPTWSYYHTVMRACGIDWRELPMRHRARGFDYDADELIAALVRRAPDLLLLTSPNNPTGTRLGYAELLRIAHAAPESLVVIDEAYYGFAEDDAISPATLLAEAPNVILLRTFSKAFGLAGLRVGFALAGSLGAALLERQPVPFGVPAFAQRIAAHRLRDHEFLAEVRTVAQAARAALERGLAEQPGFTVYDSAANFVLVKVSHTSTTAARDHLRAHGYEVKRLDEDFLRVTLARPEIMRELARILLCA
ncbi:MAG: histidinol-phosphate transaminase [Enhygromyxa sp.]